MNVAADNAERPTESTRESGVGGAGTNEVPTRSIDNHADVTEQTLPRLDEPAPYFEARSTHGFTRLTDYAGKWLIFFAHPADFTPVCASEYVAFAKRQRDFDALGCALLGLSIDSVYAHLAWRESIKQRFDVSIEFPILEDLTAEISRHYGMCQSSATGTNVVRALFIIDPIGAIRSMLWYPVTTGRSIPEVLRLVQALQTSDRLHAVTPADWKPGEDVVDFPPKTVDSADARSNSAYGCVDWYYYTRPLTPESRVART